MYIYIYGKSPVEFLSGKANQKYCAMSIETTKVVSIRLVTIFADPRLTLGVSAGVRITGVAKILERSRIDGFYRKP